MVQIGVRVQYRLNSIFAFRPPGLNICKFSHYHKYNRNCYADNDSLSCAENTFFCRIHTSLY